jgi:hypothetical protein
LFCPAGKAGDEEAERLKKLKGKGKAVEVDEEEDDEDEEDFDEVRAQSDCSLN